MRKAIISSLSLLLSLQLFAADPTVYQTTLMETGQPTSEISTAELQQILTAGSAIVFDARPAEEFAMSHIPGAVNVAPKPGQPTSLYTSDVAEIGRLVKDERSTPMVLYCNGPFCGKSKRLAADLVAAGYTNVRRYQLGMPVWRALVGLAQIELSAVKEIYATDRTAWFVDARVDAFDVIIDRARHIPLAEVTAAKDDGRLPMLDHNTRLIVFGDDVRQARDVATAIAKNAFSNVTFYAGNINDLRSLRPDREDCGRRPFERMP
jgi:rhodanese-related sulfurtransferase